MSPVLGITFRSAGRHPKKYFEGDSKTTNLVVVKRYKKRKITTLKMGV
jgi:hypothetical protein